MTFKANWYGVVDVITATICLRIDVMSLDFDSAKTMTNTATAVRFDEQICNLVLAEGHLFSPPS